MQKLSTIAALVSATLMGAAPEILWSHDVTSNGAAAPAERMPAHRIAPAQGWYPPPPRPDAGRYSQPWPQQQYWPAPQRGYGQMPPPYPPRGQYRAAPATQATAVNPLSAELKRTQEQLSAKSTELGKAHASLEQLRVILQHRLEAEITLNEKLAAITGEQQAAQQRLEELTAELNATTALLQQNRDQIAAGQRRTLELTTERDRLRDDLSSRDKQLATLQEELRVSEQALKQTESETTISSQKLSEATTRAETLKSELTGLQSQLEDLKTELREAEQARANVTNERDSAQLELAARKKELAKAQAALTTAESESRQSLTDVVAERDELQQQLAARDKELAQAQAALTTAESESGQSLAGVIAQRDDLQQQLAARNRELARAQATLKTAESESRQSLNDVIAERDELQKELATRSGQLSRAQAALATTRSELDLLRQSGTETAAVTPTPISTPPTGEETETAAVEIAALHTTGLDTDGDGIPDSSDLCDSTPQNAAVDGTGCADGVAINLEGVTFRYDSHELTREAQLILDRIAEILTRQPEMRLEVAGHTDSQGDPAYNQWLSLKRAEAVRDYIVAKGVNPNHIGAGGYGGQRPIADNSTIEGLRMNRRVELRRLQ